MLSMCLNSVLSILCGCEEMLILLANCIKVHYFKVVLKNNLMQGRQIIIIYWMKLELVTLFWLYGGSHCIWFPA